MIRASAALPAFFFAFSIAIGAILAGAQQKRLSVDEIFAYGPIEGNPPEQLHWSPNGTHLTYLESGAMIEVDSASGRTHVLISRDKLAPLVRQGGTEQDVDHRQRYHMSSYFWAPDEKHIMFDSDGTLWVYNLENGTGVQVAYTDTEAGDDPKFSPDGTMISFIRDHGSLAVVRLRETGTPQIVVAPSQKPEILNGAVDWVYEEELDVRSNYHWSPDSKNLAYLQMDENAVPAYPLVDWIPVHPTTYQQHYPQPGDPNPDVRVGVVSAKGGKTTWIRLPFQAGEDYIPRFGWVDDKTIWVETLSRDQKHRILYFAETSIGDAQKMLEIDDDKFVDDNYDIYVERGHIILSNWTSGHNEIYLYSYEKDHPLSHPAKMEKQLTTGDYEVTDVYNVDHEASVVDYAANQGNPLDQQLWEVNFDGQYRQLSTGGGFHEGNFAQAGGGYVDNRSTRISPPTVSVCREVEACRVFWATRALQAYHLRAPEELQVKASDGTVLYGTLLLPESNKGDASVPLIVNPYGGPDVQDVQNRWSNTVLFDELLAERGFAVLHADNRGMGGRGRAFAQAAYHQFGPMQLADQLTVIDAALKQHPEIDPKRLGWWGWSWGGTFTLYAMTHSDRFRAGVAIAPVTNWRDYDSIYTERYLSTPTNFAQGYRDFSVLESAANLKGHLLLVHGTGDDNVHIQNTVQFVQALIDAGIPYELKIFPRETHSLSGAKVRTELYRSVLGHFERYLMPAAEGQ
ncbi:MAG TPA: alpha/beta fold hydrolase [Terracidiphilus sp.]|nr:alpha/beta fold hydrolase [Terracidiphilus sp.]